MAGRLRLAISWAALWAVPVKPILLVRSGDVCIIGELQSTPGHDYRRLHMKVGALGSLPHTGICRIGLDSV